MRIGILFNSTHKNHFEYLNKISNCLNNHEIVQFDFSVKKPLHEFYFDIVNSNLDTLISLDFSGTELRTECNDLSLNRLGQRILILAFDALEEHKELLDFQYNFSVFLYADSFNNKSLDIVNGKDNIPNVELINVFNNNCEIDAEALLNVIKKYFSDAMLKF